MLSNIYTHKSETWIPITQAFIAIFVYLCSKATHLKITFDYSADVFLTALRRFISRRTLLGYLFRL